MKNLQSIFNLLFTNATTLDMTFTNHPESANRQLTQLFVNLKMRILFTLKNTMENLR